MIIIITDIVCVARRGAFAMRNFFYAQLRLGWYYHKRPNEIVTNHRSKLSQTAERKWHKQPNEIVINDRICLFLTCLSIKNKDLFGYFKGL